MIAWIIAAEIAFWIVILFGLVARYILKKPKLSFFLFSLTLGIDSLLILLTAIDLKAGTPHLSHMGLLLFILVFQSPMVKL